MVGDVRLEWVILGVRRDVSRRQSFSAGQETLIKAAEYIALELETRARMWKSVGNCVNSRIKEHSHVRNINMKAAALLG